MSESASPGNQLCLLRVRRGFSPAAQAASGLGFVGSFPLDERGPGKQPWGEAFCPQRGVPPWPGGLRGLVPPLSSCAGSLWPQPCSSPKPNPQL